MSEEEDDKIRIEWAQFHAVTESINGVRRDDLIRIDYGGVSGLFKVGHIGPEHIRDGRLCRYIQAFRYVRKEDSIVVAYQDWPDEIE